MRSLLRDENLSATLPTVPYANFTDQQILTTAEPVPAIHFAEKSDRICYRQDLLLCGGDCGIKWIFELWNLF